MNSSGAKILLLHASLLVSLFALSQGGDQDVLVISPLASSHCLQTEVIALSLRDRGYNVSYAFFRGHSWMDRARQLAFPILEFEFDIGQTGQEHVKEVIYNETFIAGYQPELPWQLLCFHWLNAQCDDALKDTTFMSKIKEAKFKIAIVDGFAVGPCHMLIPYTMGIPMVAVTSGFHPLEVGIPSLPSISPLTGHSQYTSQMNFMERLKNTFFTILTQSNFNPLRSETDLLRQHTTFSSWRQLYDEVSFIILARDHHLDFISPTMPHILALPGITYSPSNKLSKDLEDFMQDRPAFVIVAFGTIVPNIPLDIMKTMLETFRFFTDLPVFWTYKKSTKELDIPDNVYFSKWLPQNDLLGHSKAGLFISHCGNNGQYEAVYHGVPQICFPMFIDQGYNALRIERRGLGKSLNFHNLTTALLITTIKDILANGIMKEQCTRMSAILKSYKLPRERAADAVEHVMRFGDKHLRNEASKLPWYTLWMLDIAGFLFVAIFVFFLALIFICKLLCKLFCKNSSKIKTQ